jgi:hypothetical protein
MTRVAEISCTGRHSSAGTAQKGKAREGLRGPWSKCDLTLGIRKQGDASAAPAFPRASWVRPGELADAKLREFRAPDGWPDARPDAKPRAQLGQAWALRESRALDGWRVEPRSGSPDAFPAQDESQALALASAPDERQEDERLEPDVTRAVLQVRESPDGQLVLRGSQAASRAPCESQGVQQEHASLAVPLEHALRAQDEIQAAPLARESLVERLEHAPQELDALQGEPPGLVTPDVQREHELQAVPPWLRAPRPADGPLPDYADGRH